MGENFLFSQVPSFAILNKNLNHIQFRIYALLELYRFLNKKDITSNEIGEALGINRDFVRHNLNLMKDILQENISFHFIKSGYGKPDQLVINFKYLTNVLNVDKNLVKEIDGVERFTLEKFLPKSKYFSEFKAYDLFELSDCDSANEIIKAIIHVDNKKENKIKNLKSYFRSMFKNGIFKHDKLKFTPHNINTKILKDSPFVFFLKADQFENLKYSKDEDYRCNYFKYQDGMIIYRATYKGGLTKSANIKNLLEKYKIQYQIFSWYNGI